MGPGVHATCRMGLRALEIGRPRRHRLGHDRVVSRVDVVGLPGHAG